MLPIIKADGVELDPSSAPTDPSPLGESDATSQVETEGGCGCGGCGCGSGSGSGSGDEASTESTEPAVSTDGEIGLGDPSQVAATDLDVRTIVHAERHARIFAAVAALEPGEAFVLANDHDPKPLRFQLEAREPGQIVWAYLAEGPEVWRVRISRAAAHCC